MFGASGLSGCLDPLPAIRASSPYPSASPASKASASVDAEATPSTSRSPLPAGTAANDKPVRVPRFAIDPLLPCPGQPTTLKIQDYDWGTATVWFGPALSPDRASGGKVPTCVPADAVRLGDVVVDAPGAHDLSFTVPEQIGDEEVFSDGHYTLYIQPRGADACGVFTIGLALCDYLAGPIPRASLDPRRLPLPLLAVRQWWARGDELLFKFAADWRALPRHETFATLPRAYVRGTAIHLAVEAKKVEGMGSQGDEAILPLPAPGVYHVIDAYDGRALGFIDTSLERGDVGWGPDYWRSGGPGASPIIDPRPRGYAAGTPGGPACPARCSPSP